MAGVIFSLAEFNPMSARFYKWNFCWADIKQLYIQKQRELGDRTNAFCEFLVELVSSAIGAGKQSDTVGLDTGEGMDELSDEQLVQIKEMLGDTDFYRQYPQFQGII